MPRKDPISRAAYYAEYDVRRNKGNPRRSPLPHRGSAGNQRLVDEIKSASPCLDCGGSFPTCVMDFDHVSGVKLFNIGWGVGHVSAQRLRDEIAKCELVCSNCHRIRTWGQPKLPH